MGPLTLMLSYSERGSTNLWHTKSRRIGTINASLKVLKVHHTQVSVGDRSRKLRAKAGRQPFGAAELARRLDGAEMGPRKAASNLITRLDPVSISKIARVRVHLGIER